MAQASADPVCEFVQTADACECGRRGALYDMTRVCCRVRFLLAEPRLSVRQAWIERWRARDGSKIAGQIEAQVREQWAQR